MDGSEELVVNPHSELRVLRAGGAPSAVVVQSQRRGAHRTVATVAPSAEYGVFPLLVQLAEARGSLEISLTDEQTASLERLGMLVDPAEIPREVRYRPRLDRDLLEALPPRDRAATVPSLRGAVVHPDLVLQEGPEPPPRLPSSVREALSDPALSFEGVTAWIPDRGTSVWCPHQIEPALAAELRRWRDSGVPADIADPTLAALLFGAGILVPPDDDGARARRAIAWDRARNAFSDAAHAVLDRLLPPLTVAALRRHYAALEREGFFSLGDSLVERRIVAHNEPVARLFHAQLAPAVEAITGEPVKPSYVFFSSYLPGAVLPRHVDRAQCEYSLSFQVDYSPEPEDRTPWPLYLENAGAREPRAIHLGLGDALLYAGRRQPHHRPRLARGHRSTSLFFHFVREDFDGSLD